MNLQIVIDGITLNVWRHLPREKPTGYELQHHYSTPGMRGGRYIPQRLGTSGVALVITGQRAGWELWTESEKLEIWPAKPVALEDIAAIDTTTKCITTKAHASVAAEVTRKPLSETEYQTVQQERLIESNNARVAGLSAHNQIRAAQNQEPLPPPGVNDTILWHVQQKIVDELDTKLKSAPSASLVFTLYCRDRMTLAAMAKRHSWPYRTLKERKATLEAFLKDKFELTLAAFFVDRSIFRAAERQLQDHRARYISPQALGDGGRAEDEA